MKILRIDKVPKLVERMKAYLEGGLFFFLRRAVCFVRLYCIYNPLPANFGVLLQLSF